MSICFLLFALLLALTGVSLGKSIGSWFGPNTVAQVLKSDEHPAWLSKGVVKKVSSSIPSHLVQTGHSTSTESLCCQNRPYFNFSNNASENDNQSESMKPSADESKDDPAEESDSSTSSYSCPFAQSVIDVNQSCDWNNEALSMRNYDSEIIE
ncbi:unnamed protein product [Schistosoma mattheei]|uniref:Uncharacterized protein n=1 Tax=Schistosoma mattheei TaxID=31246 RepID=A0A183P4N0_9TREM|nr:unnamed protein product [Schistosoma mattheei]